jgi:hypothetical protein
MGATKSAGKPRAGGRDQAMSLDRHVEQRDQCSDAAVREAGMTSARLVAPGMSRPRISQQGRQWSMLHALGGASKLWPK